MAVPLPPLGILKRKMNYQADLLLEFFNSDNGEVDIEETRNINQKQNDE